ncbi:MAG: hypothetical protein M1812_001878 [Candelaria pacifica]|nr:MAG: hypothetical protein M1812_001878 [Candelaria pacifica]
MDQEDTPWFALHRREMCYRSSVRANELCFVGVSSFGASPSLVGPEHLRPLLQHALDVVPKSAVKDTPIFLLATAGMRLLPELQSKELLAHICSYARTETKFLLGDCDLHIQVIPGETEGLYGWIAANFLLGGFDSPENHDHGKGHHTYGFLDMGGASAQIAFAPNATEAERHAEDLKLLRLRTIGGDSAEYKLFVTTWLGFGVHEARRRYVEALSNASDTHTTKELPDPCLPRGLKATKKGDSIASGTKEAQGDEPYIVGTGRFDQCLRQTYPLLDKDLLDKDAPCEVHPCLLHGTHVPAIDFDVNHFVGVSEYWHTTHEIFEMAHQDKSYDFNTYQQRVEEFCSQDWHTILKGISQSKWGKKVDESTAVEVCFKASWLINVLHEGIGIPRIGLEDTKGSGHNGTKEILQHAKDKGFLEPFQAIDKIDGTEVSWAMGKMVLYAASQVTPTDGALPVGFGSNVPGTPSDFQYAGPKYNTLADDIHDDNSSNELDWHDTLFDSSSPRRIPGFLLFLLIVCIAVFLLCGHDRRTQLYRRIAVVFRRGPKIFKKRKHLGGKIFNVGSHVDYERVMGDGVGGGDLELGEIDSDNDQSDSSEGSGVVRSSGWATPRLKVGMFDNVSGSHFDNPNLGGALGLGPVAVIGNAMTRRTESRERLAPGPTTGRKSRTASPTRMMPLEESYAQ